MKLIDKQPNDVPLSEMKDGDIAIITGWTYAHYIGHIVQRYGDHLIVLGQPIGKGWTDMFKGTATIYSELRVEILKPGTKLEI